MELGTTSLLFLAVSVAVAVAGVVLARSSDAIGESLHLDRSITGFLLLAAATSLPELVVSCQVAGAGSPDMAVGSLLGSCLMNLLILAVIDLARRSRGRILTTQSAAHALASLSSILMAALVALAVLLPMLPSIGRMHSASLLIVVVYVMTFRLVYVDRRVSTSGTIQPKTANDSSDSQGVVPPPDAQRKPWRSIAFYGGSSLAIFLLARPLASSSVDLASLLQLSGTFFGAVFLALVTSLPEMVTTGEASRMGAEDLAIGNILGSNAFNLLIIAGVDLYYHQPLFSALTSVHAVAAIGIIVTTTIATMGFLYRVEKRIWYLEPDAISVILVALTFFYLLYIL